MKITRNQWILIVIGILIILLLWFMSKQKGGSGQGATTDTREDTAVGDATLRASESKSTVIFNPFLRERDTLI